jgi:hypothetical protein
VVLAAENHKSATLGTQGAVTHDTAPGNARASKSNHNETRQRLDGDVNRRKQYPPQVPKRQKYLTEDLVISIPNHQLGGKQVHKDHDPRQKPPPRTKRVKSEACLSTWVCNLLGAKRGKQDTVLEGKEITVVCAECSKQLLDSNTQARCSRCRAPLYCTNTCKAIHWAKGHQRACAPCSTVPIVWRRRRHWSNNKHPMRTMQGGGVLFTDVPQQQLQQPTAQMPPGITGSN